MADIAMCTGKDCPFKYRCYRAMAQSHELYQAYFKIPPYDAEKGACEHFWDLNPDMEDVCGS
jgi:hypothetical protein